MSTGPLPASQLLEHIAAYEQQMRTMLGDLVAIESPSTGGSQGRDVLERLRDELTAIGYRARIRPGIASGGHLVAFGPGRGGAQLLVGHADTVWPVGTLGERPLRLEGDRVYGPGVFDMKAGLVQLVFALRAIAETGAVPQFRPVVVVNTDEEIGSRESRETIERLARVACRAFVLEPGLGPEGDLKTARKGLARYTITITGRAAHAGLDPQAGASAILELSSVVQRLFALNDHRRGITVNVGTIEGGIRPNIVAPRSEAVVDVRVLRHEEAAEIDAAIRSISPSTPGTSITVTGGFGRPPMERTEGTVRLFGAARRIGRDLGMQLGEATAGGGSDGNTTAQYVPTLDGLGTVGDGAHATHEHIVASNLAPRTALLAALLLLQPEDDT